MHDQQKNSNKCSRCDGDGIITVLKFCGVPRNECCGGCTEPKECPDCKGEGIINEE